MLKGLSAMSGLSGLMGGAAGAAPSTLLTDLVAYWAMDEASGTREDSVGSADLSETGTVGAGVGILSNAADFPGTTTDILSATDSAAISLSTDTDFAISVWVKLDSKATFQIIVSKFTTASPSSNNECEYRLMYDSSNDRFAFTVGNGASNQSVLADTLGSPSTATWYHLVAQHDSAADTLSIEVNNGGADTAAWAGGTQDGALPMYVGYQPTTLAYNGLADELGLWKGRTLTAAEVTELYNAGAGVTYPFS